jgi:hypothetical protein
MSRQVHPEVLPDAHTIAGHLIEDTSELTTELSMRKW